MNYQKEFNVALNAIKKASKAILDVYNGDFTIQYKEDKTEVTIADLTSNSIIVNDLSSNFKDYGILAEESKDDLSRTLKDYCWIIDPLDGTRDFVNRTNNFAINIALSYKQEIVLGLIAIPYLNLIYYAAKGSGAYKIENGITTPIHVSNLKDNLTMVISKFFFHGQDEFEKNPLIKNIEVCGSSFKACKIAEGKAELCLKYEPVTKEWDTAPSEIIVREAGGVMTDMYGKTRLYNKKDPINYEGFIIANNLDVLNKFKKFYESK